MNTIAIDFETYYNKEYSLNRMSTQEYVLDQRFEVIGVAVKLNDEPVKWFSGTQQETKEWLCIFPWDSSITLAHNAIFDGAILEWQFGISPKSYFCTMMASRPTFVPFTERGKMSLAAVANYLHLPKKGSEVLNALGKRRNSFSGRQLLEYQKYCEHDVELCYQIYQKASPQIPKYEQMLIDATVQKFTRPVIHLDKETLQERLKEVQQDKATALVDAGLDDRKKLMSNVLFAAALQHYGVKPPMKTSPTTGKETFAFAKTDLAFKELLDHPNPKVATLVAARLKLKSTGEETRLERFIKLADCLDANDTAMGVPLLYYGAHTGRFSGLDKLNLQNLPRGSELRRALVAPAGHQIVAGDLSQIEARITATLADEGDLIKQFANGEDPYSIFATAVYGYTVSNTPKFKDERFVGKTGILSLQYGVGHIKLMNTLLNAGIECDEVEAKRIVDLYRHKYGRIKQLWRAAENSITSMMLGNRMQLANTVLTDFESLILPNGMKLRYPKLRHNDEEGFSYESKGKRVKLYGAKLIENLVQALARIVVSTAELRLFERGYPAAMQVHDELIYVVPSHAVGQFTKALNKALTLPVEWLSALPVDCEIKSGGTYYDAK